MTLAASDVMSPQHLPSWTLLAFTAGSVNATAFLACERFVAHITGVVTQIGTDLGTWILVVDSAIVLGSFMCGAVAATVLVKRYAVERAWLPLAFVIAILVGVALAGQLRWFGPFGESIESERDVALLSILAFAMGTQNAAGALRSGMAVRTTHMTGASTDLAIGLGIMLTSSGEKRGEPLAGVVLRGAQIAAFIGGAAASVPIAHHLGFAAFALPALTCTVATYVSFVPHRSTSVVRTNPQERT